MLELSPSAKLARQPVFGILNSLLHPMLVEMIACAGYDFVILDMEHLAHDETRLQHGIQLAQNQGCAPLVRVPDATAKRIGRVLDLGAHGIVLPQVESIEQVRAPSAGRPPQHRDPLQRLATANKMAASDIGWVSHSSRHPPSPAAGTSTDLASTRCVAIQQPWRHSPLPHPAGAGARPSIPGGTPRDTRANLRSTRHPRRPAMHAQGCTRTPSAHRSTGTGRLAGLPVGGGLRLEHRSSALPDARRAAHGLAGMRLMAASLSRSLSA